MCWVPQFTATVRAHFDSPARPLVREPEMSDEIILSTGFKNENFDESVVWHISLHRPIECELFQITANAEIDLIEVKPNMR